MQEIHPELSQPHKHMTITPFKVYKNHSEEKLRAHEGIWMNYLGTITYGLNKLKETGKSFVYLINCGVIFSVYLAFKN